MSLNDFSTVLTILNTSLSIYAFILSFLKKNHLKPN